MAPIPRRRFLLASSAVAGAASAYGEAETLNVALIGCGGRGVGALTDLLKVDPGAKLVAVADAFADKFGPWRSALQKAHGARAEVPAERQFVGLDAYRRVMELKDVDLVLLAAPSAFRPPHLEAALDAGKHVFAEKPVAVDSTGVRRVLKCHQSAAAKRLSVVVGHNRRYDESYRQLVKRLQAGAIGDIRSAACSWVGSSLWTRKREPQWSEAEHQLRNWINVVWLSGDLVVEQLSNNLDIANWALGSTPLSAKGTGQRLDGLSAPEFGNRLESFDLTYSYPKGVTVVAKARQLLGRNPGPGAAPSKVGEEFQGSEGSASSGKGILDKDGATTWKWPRSASPYEAEMAELSRSIRTARPINDLKWAAETALTCVMGRMAAYLGDEVTWQQALASPEDLMPDPLELGPLPLAAIAKPPRLVAKPAPQPVAADGTRKAILVGVNDYEHPKLPKLAFSANDVGDLARLLRSQGYAVTLLSDGGQPGAIEPTKRNIDRELAQALAGCRKGDTVVVALAGHGLQFTGKPDNYFCPRDAKPFAEETATLVSMNGIVAALDRSFATSKILFVDACRNDPDPGRGARGIDGAGANLPDGVAALFSCSAGEKAFELKEYRHGIFFHHLMQALAGDAKDTDGEITFDSVSAYVRKKVERDVKTRFSDGATQTPNERKNVAGASAVLIPLPAGGR